MPTKPYRPIDLHTEGAGWPTSIPELTTPEAIRAARRLWRWGMGSTFTGIIEVTSGNRRAARIEWKGVKRCIVVNPEQ